MGRDSVHLIRLRRQENGVVVTSRPDVLRLATLFARLWEHSTFGLPPNRTESPVNTVTPAGYPGRRT